MANAQCFPQPNQTVIVRQSAKPVAFTLLCGFVNAVMCYFKSHWQSIDTVCYV